VSVVHRRVVVALGLLAAGACAVQEVPYPDTINGLRATKDAFMHGRESPVPPDRRASFPPLTYFSIEPEYRVPAALTVARGQDVIEMPMSSGQPEKMRRIGRLDFTLKGHALSLTAFVSAAQEDMRQLFVPFGDLTNGGETYTGGRFLDLDRTATGIYDLDFNRAYHPFCYYNPAYICPYPPPENRLSVPVRAGERMAGGH
jgi:uncharacterized protein